MAEGVDTASFEFYEGIRIFIPGAVATALAAGVGVTFDIAFQNVTNNVLTAIFTSLVVGLIFYFIDAPARAAVVRPLQPTEMLRSWNVRPQSVSLLNAYLLMLDTIFPPAIRARALYMGSMFRIGFEIIYLLLLTAIGVLLAGGMTVRAAEWHWEFEPFRVSFIMLLIGVWGFALYRESQDKKRDKPRDTLMDPEPIKFSWPDVMMVIAAFVAFGFMIWRAPVLQSWVYTAPSAILAALWAVRYFRGYKSEGSSRRSPIDATNAVFLAGAAGLLALGCQSFSPNRLTGAEEACWSCVLALAVILIASRGHERRLRGSYSSQNTWLVHHKDEVIADFFAPPVTADANRTPADKKRHCILFRRR